MDVGQVAASTSAMTAAIRNLQAIAKAQMEVMQSIPDGQQQMTVMLQAAGVGQIINVQAYVRHN